MISDRRGFEYAELGPSRLPGAAPRYLDVPPSGSTGQPVGFDLLHIGSDTYFRYSRYLKINPNDSQTNRGAYLAVGFLSRRRLTMQVAANCIGLVAEIYGHLKGFVGPDNRLDARFELDTYAYDGNAFGDRLESRCSPLVQLDVLLQAVNEEGSLSFKPGRPIFVDPAGRADADADAADRYLHYFDQGTAGAKLRFDRERERLRSLTEKLAIAVSYADQVQDEWLAYQSVMQAHLPTVATHGTALRELIEELEQLGEMADDIRPAPGSAVGGAASSGRYSQAVARPPSLFGTVRRTHRGTSRDDAALPARLRRFVPESRLTLGIGGAIALAALVALATLFFVPGEERDAAVSETPEGAAGDPRDARLERRAAAPAAAGEAGGAVQGRSDQQDAAGATNGADDPRSNVARERAALGATAPE